MNTQSVTVKSLLNFWRTDYQESESLASQGISLENIILGTTGGILSGLQAFSMLNSEILEGHL